MQVKIFGDLIDLDARKLEVYQPPQRTALRATAPNKAEARKWTGTLPDKYLASLATLVSKSNIEAWVNALAAFHTRHTLSAYLSQAAAYVSDAFDAMGYADVGYHQYMKNGATYKNVICVKPGIGATGRVLLVCGHYDSRMEQLADATARAPGADDNASGVAAMLEVARILKDVDLEDEVRFAAFSGEEQGFWGSTAYAQHLQDTGVNLARLINLDMIGFPPGDDNVIVEYDTGNAVPGNDAASQQFGQLMAAMAADYTPLPTSHDNIYGSDYMPFEARGYVVIGAYEGGENPNYHTSGDTPDHVDFDYVTEIARMTLSTILAEALAVTNESASAVDLYIRDSASDDGSQPSPTPHWKSPDIWVRNNGPDAPGENPDDGHQPPVNDAANYLYVRVHNKGSQGSGPITVKAFRCDPATGMIWPDHFAEIGEISPSETVPAAGSVRVGPFVWTPHIVGHECLLAVVTCGEDHSVPDVFGGRFDHSVLVRYDNNVGQRNVSPENSVPGGKAKATVLVRGDTVQSTNSLTIDASDFPPDTKIEIRVPRDMAGDAVLDGLKTVRSNSLWSYLSFASELEGALVGFSMDAGETAAVTVDIDVSLQAEHLKVYSLELSQERDDTVVGRFTIEVTAVKECDDYVYGNRRSKELHRHDCQFLAATKAANKRPFSTIQEGLARGYNGCAFCLSEFDTG